MNYLEELVAEYEVYLEKNFIRRNIQIIKENRKGEMDVLSYNIQNNVITHYETSSHFSNWEGEFKKFKKKFDWKDKTYYKILRLKQKCKIKKIAITSFAKKENQEVNDLFFKKTNAKLFSVPVFIKIVRDEVKKIVHPITVPEQFPILRTIQNIIRLD